MAELLHRELTEEIIGGCYTVYRELGFGFLESVYRNALAVELSRRGLIVKREVPVEVLYLGAPVGTYRIDLLVNDKVIVEAKTQGALSVADERQLTNYLRTAVLEVGLVFNFGPDPSFRRMVFSNAQKMPSVESA